MATLTITKPAATPVTGFTLITGNRSATLTWDSTADMVEVWAGVNADGSDAELLTTTNSNTYTPSGLTGVTYFWVRAINKYGVQSAFTGPIETTPVELAQSATAGTAIATPLIPTVTNYNVWYPVARIQWTAASTDIISVSGYCSTSISNVVCTGSNRLAVYVRSVLKNDTTGYEVWSSASTQLIYDRQGTIDFGVLNDTSSCNDRFFAEPGLLIADNDYSWYMEIKKEQVVGTPTLDLVVADSSCFADAATS